MVKCIQPNGGAPTPTWIFPSVVEGLEGKIWEWKIVGNFNEGGIGSQTKQGFGVMAGSF